MHRTTHLKFPRIRRSALAALALAGLAAFAGCGEKEHGVRKLDTSRVDHADLKSIVGIAPTHRVSLTVRQGSMAFVEPAAIAAAGRISITLHNPTGADHNVVVLDADKPAPKMPGPPFRAFLGLTPVLPATSSFRHASGTTVVDLKPGNYRIVCLVLGHAVNGMSIPFKVVDAPQATDHALPNSAEAIARHLPANSVTLTRASPVPKWDKKEATVRAGRVGVRLVNRSPVPTDIAVVGADGTLVTPDGPIMGPGAAAFVIDLTPGEYALVNLPDAEHMTIPLHVR